jgi:hypothetical protein
MFRVNLAIIVAALLTAIGMSTPAYAAQLRPGTAQLHPNTALTVNDNCSDGPTFVCTDIPSGGTPPYTVTFTPVANATITHRGLHNVSGTCTVGVRSEMDSTVTDSVGAQVFIDDFWVCG